MPNKSINMMATLSDWLNCINPGVAEKVEGQFDAMWLGDLGLVPLIRGSPLGIILTEALPRLAELANNNLWQSGWNRRKVFCSAN